MCSGELQTYWMFKNVQQGTSDLLDVQKMCSWELQTYWMTKNVQLGTSDLLDVQKMCSWRTSDLLDVQKILTSEINFSVFVVNLIALESTLLMF
jgi:hypothetical protein